MSILDAMVIETQIGTLVSGSLYPHISKTENGIGSLPDSNFVSGLCRIVTREWLTDLCLLAHMVNGSLTWTSGVPKTPALTDDP